MEEERRAKFPLMCFLLALLFSQGVVNLAFSRSLEEFADQKNHYSPDPHVSPPSNPPPSPRIADSQNSPSKCSTPPKRDPGCPPCGSHGTPSPSHGHGGRSGGYHNPPPLVPTTPPSPITLTPSTPFGPTPTTPIISTPPSPPFLPVDPNTPPFTPGIIPGTPIYWNMNPGFIWGVFGYWATIGGVFGPATTLPFGRNLSVQEALANTRADGIGELYRQGMAAFLNSVVNKEFPFSTKQVRRGFTSAVKSEKMAAKQARLFKLANEGRLKKH